MSTTVHVGIRSGVEIHNGIQHCLWLLCGCCIIQIDQRFAVHLAAEDRKLRPQGLHVQTHFTSIEAKRSLSLGSNQSAMASFGIWVTSS